MYFAEDGSLAPATRNFHGETFQSVCYTWYEEDDEETRERDGERDGENDDDDEEADDKLELVNINGGPARTRYAISVNNFHPSCPSGELSHFRPRLKEEEEE